MKLIDLLLIAAAVSFTGAAYLVSLPLALVVGGVCLVGFWYLLGDAK